MSETKNAGLERLLQRLQGVEQIGANSWQALCPLHDDHHPSLRIDVKLEHGRPHPLLWCGVCGRVWQPLFDQLGLAPGSIYDGLVHQSSLKVEHERAFGPRPSRSSRTPSRPRSLSSDLQRQVEAAHMMLLEDADSLEFLRQKRGISLESVREHKLGRNGHPFVVPVYHHGALVNLRRYSPPAMGRSEPKWRGLLGVSRSLYPDPQTIEERQWLILAEGEFDALVAQQHGLPAWTHTAGASTSLSVNWRPYFEGRKVAVCYDCDDPGRHGARSVGLQLLEWNCRVKVVDLGLGAGQDITDWFVRFGRSRDDFLQLLKQTSSFDGVAS